MSIVATAALGYPRIGENREWKKSLERFWSGKSGENEFREEQAELRIRRLLRMKRSGVAVLPSGDYSLYDGILDHTVAFDLVPERFRDLGAPGSLEVYFAIARGAEGKPASEMTKWFDTNYHYIVPELGDRREPRLAFNPWLDAFNEAKEKAGLLTRPVIVGPYTYVRLAKGVAAGEFAGWVRRLVQVYSEVLAQLADAGAVWVQMDEPSLVTDVPEEHLPLIDEVYAALSSVRPNLKLMLQTYFAAAEFPKRLLALPVGGIGLDFARDGGANLEALRQEGWPADKTLGAGIVDGRGIWRADPDRALALLGELAAIVSPERLVVQTSCSLLHAPVTASAERSGDPVVRAAFAFADEKLCELVDLADALGSRLAAGADSGSAALPARLEESRAALAALRAHPARGREAAGARADSAPERAPYERRRELQQARFGLPPLPTTTIGSLPQTDDIRRARLEWRKGKLAEGDYRRLLKEKTGLWIRRQEELGLDVLVHGEFERTDMVEHFAMLLDGYHFTDNGWVQSYGSRCVKPPVIFGDVTDKGPMTLEDTVYAQSLSSLPVKGMLTGPITMLAWSFSRDDLPQSRIADQIARALNAEVLRLEAAGIGMIQVDEPALREIAPLKRREWTAYFEWAVRAFRRSVAGVADDTQIHTHMCYCDFHEIIDAIQAMDADVISLETSRSHGALIEALRGEPYGNGIGLGVYDIHSPVVPGSGDMLAVIRAALEVVPADRLWINPDCGLKTRSESETLKALREMTAAAEQARRELPAT